MNDFGLLIIRLGLGVMFVVHGAPKLVGGAEKWSRLGEAMAHVGFDFWPTLWGFMAAGSELFGGIFLAMGLFFKPSTFLLAFTMLVASIMHLARGDGILVASHAIELCCVFSGLFFVGPGKYVVKK